MKPHSATSMVLKHMQASPPESARAATLEKAAQRALHALHAAYTDRLEHTLVEILATPAVSLLSLDELTADAVRPAEPGEYCYGFSAMKSAAGVLMLSPELAGMVVTEFLHGEGILRANHALSEIEAQLLRGILQTLLQDYAAQWAQYHVPTLRLEGEFIGFQTGEPLYRATYRVETVSGSGTLALILRLPAWRTVLAGFSAPRELSSISPRQSAIFGAIGSCPLPARVLLGTMKVPLKDLLSLTEGDIMCLDTPAGSPLEIHLGNRPKLLGRVHVYDERYVVTVERSMTGSGA
ncbi:MAG: FliM/FliN family flagellar motor switch protein [Armatimonadota bacterium]